MDDFIERWDELDAFAAQLARNSNGTVWPTLAISFVGERADLFVEAPTFVVEDADAIIDGLIGFAVLWPNLFDVEGEQVWAVRVHSAEPSGPQQWTWRTRLHPYTVDREQGAVELGAPLDLPDPPDPWSQRLRTLYTRRTRRALQRRGWFAIPDALGWQIAAHPGSTTLAAFERLDV